MNLKSVPIPRKLSKKVELKGVGQVKDAIRNGGGVVPNIGDWDIPSTKKASIEAKIIEQFDKTKEPETILDSLCKTAFIGALSHSPKEVAKLVGLGGAAIVANKTLNDTGSMLDAGLTGLAVAPFVRFGAGRAQKIMHNIKAGEKAKNFLSTNLAGEALDSNFLAQGGNRLTGQIAEHAGAKAKLDEFNLANTLKGKQNLSPEEANTLRRLDTRHNVEAFHSQYNNGGLLNKLKGTAIKGTAMFSPTVREGLAQGRYVNPEVRQGLQQQTANFVQAGENKAQNLQYLQQHNINPEDMLRNIYKTNEDPDKVLNLSHEEFKKHKSIPKHKTSIGDFFTNKSNHKVLGMPIPFTRIDQSKLNATKENPYQY